MKKNINILAFCPGPGDPTSFYRGLGPLYELQREGIAKDFPELAAAYKMEDFRIMQHNINIIVADAHRFSWQQIAQADIVFMQRPHQPVLREVARLAKQMSRPLWVDLDDDHLDCPVHDKRYNLYADFDNMQAHKDILNVADIVTFSTEHLMKTYFNRGIVNNIETINNALPEWLNNIKPNSEKVQQINHNRLKVLWRGSETHSRDLAMYLPQLNSLIEDFPKVQFIFFGYVPAVNKADNVIYIPHTRENDINGYFETLATIKPDVVTVPLELNNFNRCKSNIAMLEAHWTESFCIGPDLPEWHDCLFNYFDPKSFFDKVDGFINSPNLELYKTEEARIVTWLTQTNAQRATVIQKLFNREYKVNNQL